jgi:hypothetical protein
MFAVYYSLIILSFVAIVEDENTVGRDVMGCIISTHTTRLVTSWS